MEPQESDEHTEKNMAIQVPNLFGREPETSKLRGVLESVRDDRTGSVLLLAGESGTGKSALAEWCLAIAASEGFDYSVVRATCEPFHAGMSMFPILEIIRRLCGERQSAGELVARGFGGSSNEISVANLAFDSNSEPGSRRECVMATFANVVVAASRSYGRPVAVFVDDLERIDTASVDALTVLISRISEAPVILLGAYRSDLVAADRSHNLESVVDRCRHGERRCEILEIRPLEERFTRPMVEDYFGNHVDVSEHFLRRLYRETEGNPLYIREVLRGLQDHRGPDGEALLRPDSHGVWTLTGAIEFWEIPQSIEDAIATRLAPLSPDENDVLESASIIGRRFKFETLDASCTLPDEVIFEAIEKLTELELMREVSRSDDELEFTHGKVREVVINRMTGLRKTRLHAKIAEVLSNQRQLFSPEEWEIAMGTHLLLARKYDSAAPHLLNAGNTSLTFLAGTEAAMYFRQCLEALEKSSSVDPTKLADVRLLLGEALLLGSQLDSATRELETVANTQDSLVAQRWALDFLGDICRLRDQVSNALEFYRRCETLAHESNDHELLAEVTADLAELHMRQFERLAGIDPESSSEHESLYKKYLDLETEYVTGSLRHDAQARSLRNRAKFERVNGDPNTAISLYEQSLRFTDIGVASHQFLIPYAKALRLVGRNDDAMAQVQTVLDWSRQIGAPRSEAIARQYLGLLLVERSLEESGDLQALTLSKAKGELVTALKLHEEANFRQGYRETAVDLFELAVLQNDGGDVLKYLHMTDDYSGRSKSMDECEICVAVVSQLRVNGEGHRAERIEVGLKRLGIGQSKADTK